MSHLSVVFSAWIYYDLLQSFPALDVQTRLQLSYAIRQFHIPDISLIFFSYDLVVSISQGNENGEEFPKKIDFFYLVHSVVIIFWAADV